MNTLRCGLTVRSKFIESCHSPPHRERIHPLAVFRSTTTCPPPCVHPSSSNVSMCTHMQPMGRVDTNLRVDSESESDYDVESSSDDRVDENHTVNGKDRVTNQCATPHPCERLKYNTDTMDECSGSVSRSLENAKKVPAFYPNQSSLPITPQSAGVDENIFVVSSRAS
jgi:hypothetical protein